MSARNKSAKHWQLSIIYTLSILGVWFLASFGCSILFRGWCDANLPKVGNVPFGFWMSQQGSIMTFIALLAIYAVIMGRLDKSLEKEEKA